MAKITTLDCGACKSDKTMEATKTPKYSLIVRTIGGIIVIPSVLGVIIFVRTIFSIAGQMMGDDAEADAEVMETAVGLAMVLGGVQLWHLV